MRGCFRCFVLFIATGLFATGIGNPVFAHKWVDVSGKHSVEAEFASLDNGTVKLRQADGHIISVPLTKLSEESQERAKQLAAGRDDSNPFQATAAETTSSDSPASTPPTPSSADGTVRIIAEGVGTTADDALKDAFRNAVRQVVGAVVDGETLVKNDELIDQVLTYSDGFVKSYKELGGAKKASEGLSRIKIAAVIERRSVIAKLKATNVSTTELNGKNLFAEAVTQAEAEKDATQLLKKAIADLPTLLTAEIVGKRDYDRATSEITLTVVVKPDLKAYDAFALRLEETLKKICIAKNSTLIKAQADKSVPNALFFEGESDKFALAGPHIAENMKTAWCIWLCSGYRTKYTNLRWNSYIVDADMGAVLADLEMADVGRQTPVGRTIVTIEFLAADRSVITEDEFEVIASRDRQTNNWWWLRQMCARNLKGYLSWSYQSALTDVLAERAKNNFENTINCYIAPFSFVVSNGPNRKSNRDLIRYKAQHTYDRRVTATLDELKQIMDVRCKVVWKPSVK